MADAALEIEPVSSPTADCVEVGLRSGARPPIAFTTGCAYVWLQSACMEYLFALMGKVLCAADAVGAKPLPR